MSSAVILSRSKISQNHFPEIFVQLSTQIFVHVNPPPHGKVLTSSFFRGNLTGQKGRHFSYVLVPGRGLFFSATCLGKKGIISRTFQFLAGAFFSPQLIWAKRTLIVVRSSSWQGPFFLSNLSGQEGHKLSYVPVPGRGLFSQQLIWARRT